MPESKERLLEQLKRTKRSCTLLAAEETLAAWGFNQGRSKGHVRAWNLEEITLTLHQPHGKHLDPGAVALIIKKIDEAVRRREKTEETDTHAG